MEPERRGVKLLEKLTGDAFDKLELVDPRTLKTWDGVDKFRQLLWGKYEPMERHRVGRVMDKFLEEFSRRGDEEMMDYNTRFDKEVMEVEKVAGTLAPTWKAHLYLKKMKLRDDKLSLILTASLGDYSIDAFKKAALSTFPSVQAIRSQPPQQHGGGGGQGWLARKGRTQGHRGPHRFGDRGRTHKAHECHPGQEEPTDTDDDDSPDDEDSGDDDKGVFLEQSVESDFDDLPEELRVGVQEAEAFITQAKKHRSEIEKARGFFKRGATGDSRDKTDRIKKLKARLPCAKCGQLGHWKDDPECPMNKKNQSNHTSSQKRGKPTGSYFTLYDKGSDCKCSIAYMADQNRVEPVGADCFSPPEQESIRGLIDTACAKTVSGEPWAKNAIIALEAMGIDVVRVDESEPFRFGLGKHVYSEYALLFPVLWGGITVIIRISVVPRDVPLLISKPVLKRLGGVIDLERTGLSSEGFVMPPSCYIICRAAT